MWKKVSHSGKGEQMKRMVITGINGFIGRSAAAYFRGEYENEAQFYILVVFYFAILDMTMLLEL